MKATLLIDVHQWFPDKPHPAVKTSVLSASLSIDLHHEIYMQVKYGKGQVGCISVFDPGQGIRWKLVKPGDWIIGKRNFVLLSDEQFHERYKLVT